MLKKIILFLFLIGVAYSQDNYYMDYTNGIDTALGKKQGNFTADGGTNTTTVVDAELDGLPITDNAASGGDFVWNVTRSLGGFVDAFDDGTDTITLVGSIAGQTTGDTYYLLSAWKTITKYTTEARTAGDDGFLRAGDKGGIWLQGTEAVDISFLSDGSVDLLIELIGCDSVTNDPWVDASDVLPIIDFENGSFNIAASGDDFWKLTRLDIRQSADGNGAVSIGSAYKGDGFMLVDCTIRDGATTSIEGVRVSGGKAMLDNCTFRDCEGVSIQSQDGGLLIVKNSSIDAGSAGGSTYGAYVVNAGCIEIIDTTMAGTNAFDTTTLRALNGGDIILRNVTFGTETYETGDGISIFSEDNDGVFESQERRYPQGIIVRDTASARGGGADSYTVLTPNAACGVNQPLLHGDRLIGFSQFWATASTQLDISVYARVGTAWDIPIDSGGEGGDVYVSFSYLSEAGAGDATRTEIFSTETLSNVADWTTGVHALTSGNFTPLKTGWVYMKFFLTETDGVDYAEEVWVDILPVVSET